MKCEISHRDRITNRKWSKDSYVVWPESKILLPVKSVATLLEQSQ